MAGLVPLAIGYTMGKFAISEWAVAMLEPVIKRRVPWAAAILNLGRVPFPMASSAIVCSWGSKQRDLRG